jgi:hypothetical protein
MCNGRGTPGNKTTDSGKSGSSLTPLTMSLASLITCRLERCSKLEKTSRCAVQKPEFRGELLSQTEREKSVCSNHSLVADSRRLARNRINNKEILTQEGLGSDEVKRAWHHPAHSGQQLFGIKRLVEKLISAHLVTSFASLCASCRSDDQHLRFGKISF